MSNLYKVQLTVPLLNLLSSDTLAQLIGRTIIISIKHGEATQRVYTQILSIQQSFLHINQGGENWYNTFNTAIQIHPILDTSFFASDTSAFYLIIIKDRWFLAEHKDRDLFVSVSLLNQLLEIELLVNESEKEHLMTR